MLSLLPLFLQNIRYCICRRRCCLCPIRKKHVRY